MKFRNISDEKKPRHVKVVQVDKMANRFFVDTGMADMTNN